MVRQGQEPRCGHGNGCRTVRAGAEVSPAPYRLSFIRVWPIRAVNWGLRSPNSDANNAYYINTDGSVNNNNVYNANFAPRPALMEYRVQLPNMGESRGPSSKEAISCRGELPRRTQQARTNTWH
ncbi:DUF6273 domain-containing protein [Flintibacter porci]|uniref:DUF6273 domain-containing protein n=1 Tax=Flintibacter porci TaxID=3342383 RepID=UPI003F88CA2E